MEWYWWLAIAFLVALLFVVALGTVSHKADAELGLNEDQIGDYDGEDGNQDRSKTCGKSSFKIDEHGKRAIDYD